jgi:hypothetical protein
VLDIAVVDFFNFLDSPSIGMNINVCKMLLVLMSSVQTTDTAPASINYSVSVFNTRQTCSCKQIFTFHVNSFHNSERRDWVMVVWESISISIFLSDSWLVWTSILWLLPISGLVTDD